MMPTRAHREILRAAGFAVMHEILDESMPVSSVLNPDGGQQPETIIEHQSRIVLTAIMYCIEQGLLVVPEDIEQGRWKEGGYPTERGNRDGIRGLRLEDGSLTT
jgi:hypothetical protein